MLGHVYVVEDARDLAQIVRDVTRYGGAYRPEVCHFLLFHRQPTQTDFKLRISTSLFSDGQIGRKSRRRWIKRCIISVLKRIAWSAKLIFSCPCGEEFEFTCHLLVSYFQELPKRCLDQTAQPNSPPLDQISIEVLCLSGCTKNFDRAWQHCNSIEFTSELTASFQFSLNPISLMGNVCDSDPSY